MKEFIHDIPFLRALDNDHNKIIYAKIIALTKDEQPIEAIEGVVQSGSINIDGKSAVRRSCNLTVTTKKLHINEVYWGFTTKIKIEIGLQNNINPQYDKIIWFKQGIYILTEFKTSQQVNNYTISLTGKDKMCLLNGDIGGHFNAETNLSVENHVQDNGEIIEYKPTIKYIIREMMHHWGQEPWANIIINDIDDYGLRMLDNNSENTYYLWREIATGKYVDITDANRKSLLNNQVNNILPNNVDFNTITFINGLEEDANNLNSHIAPTGVPINNPKYYIFKIEPLGPAGYERIELEYDKELIASPGDTITSILDKLVNMLGPFEYFYNLDGQFVFQAKATYMKTQWIADTSLDDVYALSYVTPALMRDKTSYYFENGVLLTAAQNNPNMLNIRNDFTIWGKRKTSSGIEIPIHARYAIDKKPLFYVQLNGTQKLSQLTLTDNYTDYLQHMYITQEGLTILENSLPKINPNDYRKHSMPSCFNGDERWWNIEDWAEYYKAFTGALPSKRIYEYQAENSTGFTGTLYFANGLNIAPGSYGLSTTPFQIVDIERLGSDSDECIPAGFLGITENGRLSFKRGLSPFQHRHNGCYHSYSYFLDLMDQGYESWFFDPYLTFISDEVITNKDEINWQSIVTYFKTTGKSQVVDWRELIYLMAKDYYKYNHDDTMELFIMLMNKPISQQLNITDYLTGKTGYEQYYHDIEGFWRMLYDPYHKNTSNTLPNEGPTITYNSLGWNVKVEEDPTELLFWFDFYETTMSNIGRFSVPAIGARTKVVNDEDVRVIVYKDTPDVIYYSNTDADQDDSIRSAHGGYSFLTFTTTDTPSTYFKTSIRKKSAKETMDNLLYNHSHTNDSITLTSVPIYYLQPNSIIHVYDDFSHIDGYYEVSKLTLPLSYNGTMTISAVKIPQQIY